MSRGLHFLHQLLLTLLCFLKEQLLLTPPDDIMLVLSISSLKEMDIPWEEVINLTQGVSIN